MTECATLRLCKSVGFPRHSNRKLPFDGPDVRQLLSAHIPDARKALLLSEVDRVVNDYRVHRDEIHSKLVAIMRERLQVQHAPP